MTLLDSFNKYRVVQIIKLDFEVRFQMNTCCCSPWFVQVSCFAFSPDGILLAAGCAEGPIYIFGLTNGKWAQVSVLEDHSDIVRYFCY